MTIITKFLGFFTKSKLTVYLCIAVAIMLVICFVLLRVLNATKLNNVRLQNNYKVAQNGLKSFETKAGNLAYTVGTLELENKEIRAFYEAEVLDNLKEFNIRLRQLEIFNANNIQSEHIIETTLRDSLIIREDKVENLQYIDYKSPYLDFHQIQYGDLVRTKITKRDSLIQVIYNPYREGFVLTRWIFKRKPPLEQVIKSADPNSTITYNKYIIPVRNKRK